MRKEKHELFGTPNCGKASENPRRRQGNESPGEGARRGFEDVLDAKPASRMTVQRRSGSFLSECAGDHARARCVERNSC
jgi:hypothetical protein